MKLSLSLATFRNKPLFSHLILFSITCKHRHRMDYDKQKCSFSGEASLPGLLI